MHKSISSTISRLGSHAMARTTGARRCRNRPRRIRAMRSRPSPAGDRSRSTSSAPAPFGWWAAIVIALVAFIDRVEVNLVAGALPAIQDHFGFGDTLAGAIPTAAAIAGVVLLLPAGRLADTGRRTAIIALVVLVWAAVLGVERPGDLVRALLRQPDPARRGRASSTTRRPPACSPTTTRPQPRQGVRPGAGRLLHGPARSASPSAACSPRRVGWRGVFFIVAVPGAARRALVLTRQGADPRHRRPHRPPPRRHRRAATSTARDHRRRPRDPSCRGARACSRSAPCAASSPAWRCSTSAWAASSTGCRPCWSAPRASTTTRPRASPAASAAPASSSASSSAAGSATAATA